MNTDLGVLLRKIYALEKTIVTMLDENGRHSSFDIEDGIVTCAETNHNMNNIFESQLHDMLHNSGVLVLREFLRETFKTRVPNGEMMDLPKKNIYNVILKNGIWMALSESRVSESHNTDSETGELICPEEGVSYRTL